MLETNDEGTAVRHCVGLESLDRIINTPTTDSLPCRPIDTEILRRPSLMHHPWGASLDTMTPVT